MPFWAGPSGNVPLQLDEKMGWRANESFHFVGKKTSADGRRYAVNASLKQFGFRTYGDLKSPRPRVLVLGDSFTQAVEVSDDKTYHSVMQQRLDGEIFAYGAGGFGTLQEFMILDRFVDLIKPSVIVWQIMSNDVINDSPELEFQSRINNNGMVRPYLVNGRVKYLMPTAFPTLRRLLMKSRLGFFLISRVDRLMARMSTVEQEIERGGPSHAGFQRAVNTLEQTLVIARSRAGSIPMVAFMPDEVPPYFDAIQTVCARQGISFAREVPDAVLRAQAAGTPVLYEDGYHWNENGHRIAGEALSAYLVKLGYLHRASDAASLLPRPK
jgi:lysophospholipase L1-like esterase